jgi:hypothetical protein
VTGSLNVPRMRKLYAQLAGHSVDETGRKAWDRSALASRLGPAPPSAAVDTNPSLKSPSWQPLQVAE